VGKSSQSEQDCYFYPTFLIRLVLCRVGMKSSSLLAMELVWHFSLLLDSWVGLLVDLLIGLYTCLATSWCCG